MESRILKAKLTAFLSGVLFAIGLGVAGMTKPTKVLDFLDVAGAWDPSLAFVMMGAIGVHFFFLRRARKMTTPLYAERFVVPSRTALDARLVGGAAVFGVGWGLSGYCPGPALVAAISLAPSTGVFVICMGIGSLAARALRPTA